MSRRSQWNQKNMIHLLDHPTAIFGKILLWVAKSCIKGFGLACLNTTCTLLRWYICISNYNASNIFICKNYVDSYESSTINGQNGKFLDSCNFWQFNSLKGKKRCARGQKKLSKSWRAWTSRLNWQNEGKMKAPLPRAPFDDFQHLATIWKLDVWWNVEMSIICHFACISHTFKHQKVSDISYKKKFVV